MGWEKAADNLIYTNMDESMTLYLKFIRFNGISLPSEEIPILLPKDALR